MKSFKLGFGRFFALSSALVSIWGGAPAFAQQPSPRAPLDDANAMAACSAQLPPLVEGSNTIWDSRRTVRSDLDIWEYVGGQPGRMPSGRAHAMAVLNISRSFQRVQCPPTAMDCGGGHFVYQCALRTRAEGTEGTSCGRDLNRYGYSSACLCAPTTAYDPRLGRCYPIAFQGATP